MSSNESFMFMGDNNYQSKKAKRDVLKVVGRFAPLFHCFIM